MTRLEWYPKPTGPGDLEGAGAQRLLGQPDVDRLELLVRETAQNSWDARLGTVVPEYRFSARSVSESERSCLRDQVFSECAPDSALADSLSKPSLRVLEISDRGTKGLGGPLRNDRVEDDPVRDWMDFVLTLGAPPDNKTGGGTYGFGKTASYVASRCSTIVIWSVTRVGAVLEHRLIASSMADSFAMDGIRYTGRQWWGVLDRNNGADVPYPVIGDVAQEIGERLFERHFHPGESGTSLLIIDPIDLQRIDEDDVSSELAAVLPIVGVHNLWPKMTGAGLETDMQLSFVIDGHELPLPNISASPTLEALQLGLGVIRAKLRDPDALGHPMVHLTEIRSLRPKERLGWLALVRYMPAEHDPLEHLAGTVSLMRRPELVVRADTPKTGSDSIRWVGVFKSVDELDRTFAASEPPAHDNWSPEAMQDRAEKRRVNLALQRIRDAVKDFLTPNEVAEKNVTVVPTAMLANRLSALAAGVGGGGSTGAHGGKRGRKAGGSRKRQVNTVRILSSIPLPSSESDLRNGREQSSFELSLDGPDEGVLLQARKLAIAVDGGLDVTEGLVTVERWLDAAGQELSRAPQLPVVNNQVVSVHVSYPEGLAIDVDFKVEALP